jgi:hypothetical protein
VSAESSCCWLVVRLGCESLTSCGVTFFLFLLSVTFLESISSGRGSEEKWGSGEVEKWRRGEEEKRRGGKGVFGECRRMRVQKDGKEIIIGCMMELMNVMRVMSDE